MIKKLVKVGNSQAIVLDKAIIELLGMGEGSAVSLKLENGRLIVEPVHCESISEDSRVQSAYEKFTKRYDSTLKKLAK